MSSWSRVVPWVPHDGVLGLLPNVLGMTEAATIATQVQVNLLAVPVTTLFLSRTMSDGQTLGLFQVLRRWCMPGRIELSVQPPAPERQHDAAIRLRHNAPVDRACVRQ
jgi:hypothetical protein